MIAPPLVVWLAMEFGWRGAFFITGSLGFLWIAGFAWFRGRAVEMREPAGPQSLSASRSVGWRRLIPLRQTWIVFVCRFLADPIWYFYVFWIPKFLTR